MFKGLDDKTRDEAIQVMEDEMVRQEIIKILQVVAAKIDPEIKVFDDDVFQAAPLEKMVYVCADEYLYKYDDNGLMETITKEVYPNNPISVQTYAFFHEVGHILAAKEYDDPIEIFNEHEGQLLYLSLIGPDDQLERNRRYKQLKVESDADYMAIQLIESNIQGAIELDNLLHKIAKGK